MDHTKHTEDNKKVKQKAALAIKKAQGTLIRSIDMIQNDKYCPEIIQQIDAAIGLLQASKKNLLVGHLNHCLEDKLKEDKDKTIQELIKILKLA